MVKQAKDRLDKKQVERAAQALLKHIAVEASKKGTKSLIADEGDEMITLLVALRKIPKSAQTKPIRMYVVRPGCCTRLCVGSRRDSRSPV